LSSPRGGYAQLGRQTPATARALLSLRCQRPRWNLKALGVVPYVVLGSLMEWALRPDWAAPNSVPVLGAGLELELQAEFAPKLGLGGAAGVRQSAYRPVRHDPRNPGVAPAPAMTGSRRPRAVARPCPSRQRCAPPGLPREAGRDCNSHRCLGFGARSKRRPRQAPPGRAGT
jgi:hypothetical protein